MKRNNKKGFTIVELVIVIAVIAILAAVLIPTFSSLIKKANIASDTALAKNLNTALVADEAIDGKPTDFSDVLAVLRENGYIVENLNPTTAGHFFVWEKESNQILLVNEEYQIVYSSKELAEANNDINPSWFFAVKSAALVADIQAKTGSVIPAVDTAWVGTDGQKVSELLNKGGVITLNESITLTKAPAHKTGTKNDALRILDTKVVYNLAGQTMTVSSEFDTSFKKDDGTKTGYSAIHVGKDATLELADGSIVASVQSNTNGLSLYGVLRVFEGGLATVENMNIVYNGVDNGSQGAGAVFTVNTSGNLTVKDTIVTVSNSMGAEVADGTATFENVTFKNGGDGAWNDICVAVSYGGTANIKSGTYISATNGNAGYCVGVLPTGGTLNISGGTFEGNLYIDAYSDKTAEINITGGTFNGKTFSSMTAADWDAILGESDGGEAVITGVGTSCVSIKIG